MSSFESQLNISANLTREDRAYIEKIDARILGLLGGKHVREVKDAKILEQIWELVKARGEYLRSDALLRKQLLTRWNIEVEVGYQKQYERNLQHLIEAKIVSYDVGKSDFAITGVDGVEYAVPTWDAVRKKLYEKDALLRVKRPQGFTRLLLVPSGMPVVELIKRCALIIREHFDRNDLRTLSGQQFNHVSDTEISLERGMEKSDLPVKKSVQEGDFLYYPDSVSDKNPQGLTKIAYLEDQTTQSEEGTPGWDVVILEESLQIPRQRDDAEIREGRERIRGGKTPEQYLEMLQNDPQYTGECGMTIEAELMAQLMSIMETGHVIDHEDSGDCANLLLGTLWTHSNKILMNKILLATWQPRSRQVDAQFALYGRESKIAWGSFGVRPMVKL